MVGSFFLPLTFSLRSLLSEIAYTIYSFFEWSLILTDVGFDAATALDFANIEVIIKDAKGVPGGYVLNPPINRGEF